MSQDPTGSGASSISSSSDIAESDERNDEDGDDDEDDDGTTPPTSLTTGIATDHTNNTHKLDEDRYEDHYESIVNDETCTLEYCDPYESQQKSIIAPKCVRYHQSVECVETTLINAPTTCELEDSGSSDSANSLDDLCGSHRSTVDDNRFDRHGELTNNGRDHYMVPTRNPRELNERILSLFNPQFLPNFNNMITYVASPPSRSQSMAQYNNEDDNFLLRNTNYRKHTTPRTRCVFDAN